jgi:cytoskeleton protein RodZ
MSIDSTESEYTTVGDLLRQTRIKQGIDLEQISIETKITLSNLKAIEDDDFNSLPAEAFARGFYALYANALALAPEEVLRIYTKEKSQLPNVKRGYVATSPGKLAKKVDNMAERPTVMPVSCSGVIIFFLLLIGAFLSWYFSWNPATFLSGKLKSFQKTPESQQTTENTVQSNKKDPLFEIVQVKEGKQSSKENAPEQQVPENTPNQ